MNEKIFSTFPADDIITSSSEFVISCTKLIFLKKIMH